MTLSHFAQNIQHLLSYVNYMFIVLCIPVLMHFCVQPYGKGSVMYYSITVFQTMLIVWKGYLTVYPQTLENLVNLQKAKNVHTSKNHAFEKLGNIMENSWNLKKMKGISGNF